jgi:hypothetical protein
MTHSACPVDSTIRRSINTDFGREHLACRRDSARKHGCGGQRSDNEEPRSALHLDAPAGQKTNRRRFSCAGRAGATPNGGNRPQSAAGTANPMEPRPVLCLLDGRREREHRARCSTQLSVIAAGCLPCAGAYPIQPIRSDRSTSFDGAQER